MAKYIIQLTDILLDGEKLHEGGEVDLTEKQSAGILDYLIPVVEEKKTTKAKSGEETNGETV